jgi:predicted ATPase
MLEGDDAGIVQEICRRLDGVPLAIELAAARCRTMAFHQLRAALDDALPLLTGGPRTVLPRQRTLDGSIRWSHDLLTVEEQIAFRRLAVFAGGCTLDAAMEILSDAALVLGAVLEVLDGLVRQSMVQVELDELEPRFVLLETVRQFAGQRLDENGDERAARLRHASYYMSWAERLSGHG